MGLQPEDFRYTLTLDNIDYIIIFAPEGWDKETKISYKRGLDYKGMIRSYALPLKFVLGGADVLRAAFNKYGYEAEVSLLVELLDRSTYTYSPFATGYLDFSQYDDQSDYVSITLMESGATRNIKAYEGITYEYSLDGPDSVNMILPGVAFNETSTDIVVQEFELLPGVRTPAIDLITNGANSGFVILQNVTGETNPNYPTSANWMLTATRALTVNIKGYARLAAGAFGPGDPAVLKLVSTQTITPYILGSVPATLLRTIDFDINVNLGLGEKLFFIVDPGSNRSFFDEAEITISYSAVSDPSNCKGLSAYDLYKKIINRISPGTAVTSYELQNNWPNLIFTSGDAIREIAGAKLKISFKDFFQTFNALTDIGFGIESNTAVLEKGSYFARDIEIAKLSDVKFASFSVATDFIFNSVEVGYDDGNTDKTDGRQEYNSGQEWEMPVTRVQRKEDWVSPTRADQYGIEQLRVTYNVNKEGTADTSSDNDAFMIYCEIDGTDYRPILGASYASVEGLISPRTAYNLELTPKKNLLRHAPYLRSMLDKLDGRYINFGSGDKNTELTTIKNGVRVKENEGITVASLQGKYFVPIKATVKGALPKGIMRVIDGRMYGYVSFDWKGTLYRGLILEMGVDIAKNTEQDFTLLLTPLSLNQTGPDRLETIISVPDVPQDPDNPQAPQSTYVAPGYVEENYTV